MADRAEPENPQEPTDSAQATADTAHVFISYASPDGGIASALVEHLERQGIPCWIAPRNVDAGALYADAIVRAIGGAKAFVLVLSESAIASAHVGKEVERASSKKRPIFAVRIDGAPLTPALEYFLSESQWIDARTGKMEPAYAKLIGAIRKSAATAPWIAPAVKPSAGTAPAARPRRPRNRILFAATLAVAAVAGVAILAGKVWLAKQVATQRMMAATNGVDGKSIAVLPFTDMSEKKDQEYFADGMAEEILDVLARIPGLTVIGRTSSFQFKGKNADLRTIGTQLNAAYVLEGSIRKSSDRVRITAQLVNTRTGTHVWSDTYDRQIGDVLKLQDAIAAAVVRELQLTVTSASLISHTSVADAESYDLILRGRHAADRGDKEGLDEAVRLFQQAIDRNPTSADAAANLASTYLAQTAIGSLGPAAGFEQSRRAATNALNLDAQNVLANSVMASIHITYDWDWAGAERLIRHMASLTPGNVDVLRAEATLSGALGRWDDALRQIKAALAQDPINPFVVLLLEGIEEGGGHLAQAEAAARRLLDIRPTFDYGHYTLGVVLLARGDRDGALLEMQQETNEAGKQEGLALVYHALGRKAQFDATFAGMLKNQADGNALGIAGVYAFCGQADDAMHWLERAYAQKDPFLYAIKGNSFLQNLGDPRFKTFLRKMNLPE